MTAATLALPIVQLVKQSYGSWISSTRGRGGVHRAGAAQPAPLRGGPRLLPRGAGLTGRSPVRLHPVGAGSTWSATTGPGSWSCSPRRANPAAARAHRRRTPPAAGSSRCAAKACRSTRSAHGWPRGHPAQPHRGRPDPGRGRLRPAAAPPRARGQHQPGHRRAATPHCPAPRSSTSPPCPPRPTPAGRAAAGRPGPGRPATCPTWPARPATPAPASSPRSAGCCPCWRSS